MKPYKITFADGGVVIRPDTDIQAAITEARMDRRFIAYQHDKKPCVDVVKAELIKETEGGK